MLFSELSNLASLDITSQSKSADVPNFLRTKHKSWLPSGNSKDSKDGNNKLISRIDRATPDMLGIKELFNQLIDHLETCSEEQSHIRGIENNQIIDLSKIPSMDSVRDRLDSIFDTLLTH